MPRRQKHSAASALMLGIRCMWHNRPLAVLFLVITLTQGSMQGLLVWTLRNVLRAFGGDAALGSLVLGAALVFGVWLLRSLSTFAAEVTKIRLAWSVTITFTQRVIAKLLTFSVSSFERSSGGELIMASWQDVAGVRTVTLDVGTIMLSLSRLLGLTIAAWVLSPKLALIGFVALPLGMIPAHSLGRRIEFAAKRRREKTVSLHDIFLQVSSGLRVIKVNRVESLLLDQLRRVGQEIYRRSVQARQLRSLSVLLLDAVGGVGVVAVIIVGGWDVTRGVLDWQTLLGLLFAVIMLHAPILSLLRVYNGIRVIIPSLNRIDEILEMAPELPDAPNAQRLSSPPRTIELQDVSFAYSEEIVLDSVSATFRQGETIGIVGPSGAGKSTLIALMLRLYDPTRGRILYDGIDLRQIRGADVFDQSSIVLQEPFLFLDTIANNIRFTRSGASMDEVIAAAKAANIHDEIVLMPDGYDTMLGPKDGRGISVGQKQRICIAAALLRNAPILFLDEATSSLDSVSERVVHSAIVELMKGRTTFVVAHRLSTLRAADRIMVLDRGRLVGFGKHEELLETCATYRQPWSYQSAM